jgi:hypothetical protein
VIQPCPHCGQPLVCLPSGKVATPAVVAEVGEIMELGEEWIQEILADPNLRAQASEWLPMELFDPEDPD